MYTHQRQKTEPNSNTSQQLSRLEELENSLKSMQTRIQYLLKEESKNQKNIHKALKASIDQVGHKMNQAQTYQQMRKLQQSNDNKRNLLHESIIEIKTKQKHDLSAIKENIKENKKLQSKTIKQLSKKNEIVIQQNRRKNMEIKKNKVQQMKQLREDARTEQQVRKEEKERSIHKQKEVAIAQRLRNKQIIEGKIKQLSRLQLQLISTIQKSSETSRAIQEATQQSMRIPKSEFYKIIRDTKRQNKGMALNQECLKTAIFEKFIKKKVSGVQTNSEYQNKSQVIIIVAENNHQSLAQS